MSLYDGSRESQDKQSIHCLYNRRASLSYAEQLRGAYWEFFPNFFCHAERNPPSEVRSQQNRIVMRRDRDGFKDPSWSDASWAGSP